MAGHGQGKGADLTPPPRPGSRQLTRFPPSRISSVSHSCGVTPVPPPPPRSPTMLEPLLRPQRRPPVNADWIFVPITYSRTVSRKPGRFLLPRVPSVHCRQCPHLLPGQDGAGQDVSTAASTFSTSLYAPDLSIRPSFLPSSYMSTHPPPTSLPSQPAVSCICPPIYCPISHSPVLSPFCPSVHPQSQQSC